MAFTGNGTRPRVLCSMGAIARGPQAISEHRIVEIAPQLDVDGVEMMIYESWYDRLDEVADQLAASGLVIPATHGEKSIGPGPRGRAAAPIATAPSSGSMTTAASRPGSAAIAWCFICGDCLMPMP